jgi:putative transposase
LELIRYIHLNPLRAGVVKDISELDKYPWAGHSAILGRRKNPLLPKQPNKRNGPDKPNKPEKALAEKTIEDVLLHFGDTKRVACQRYREFVKNGIDQGRRPDLQGGGLLRSAGGDKRALLGRKKGEREKGDERILGGGDFVNEVLSKAGKDWERGQRYDISLGELIAKVAKGLNIKQGDIVSSRRQSNISNARAIICYLAVREMNLKGIQVAKALQISGQSVSRCTDRGRDLFDKGENLYQYL